MAYDLIFGQTNKDHSRGGPVAVGVVLAASLLVLPRLLRRREVSEYRRTYAYDYDGGRPLYKLKTTVESPAVTMADLIASGK